MDGNGTTNANGGTPLVHGQFIPNQREPLPWAVRVAIAVGLAVVIIALYSVSSNFLAAWGTWVGPVMIGIFGVASIVVWAVDEARHPSILVDDEVP